MFITFPISPIFLKLLIPPPPSTSLTFTYLKCLPFSPLPSAPFFHRSFLLLLPIMILTFLCLELLWHFLNCTGYLMIISTQLDQSVVDPSTLRSATAGCGCVVFWLHCWRQRKYPLTFSPRNPFSRNQVVSFNPLSACPLQLNEDRQRVVHRPLTGNTFQKHFKSWSLWWKKTKFLFLFSSFC